MPITGYNDPVKRLSQSVTNCNGDLVFDLQVKHT